MVVEDSVLLELGLGGKRSPLDELVERVSRSDREEWARRAADGVCLAAAGGTDRGLVEGTSTEQELLDVKRAAKSALRRAGSREERLLAAWAYALATAAGLAYTGKYLGKSPNPGLRDVLAELGALLPEPWGPVFTRGAAGLPRVSEEDAA